MITIIKKSIVLKGAAIAIALSASSSIFAAVNYTFDANTAGKLAPQDGWVNSDPLASDPTTPSNTDTVGYIANGYSVSPTDKWAQLGFRGLSESNVPTPPQAAVSPDVPGTAAFSLSNTFAAPGDAVYGFLLTSSFAVVNNNATTSGGFNGKDTFGFQILVGNAVYATLLFIPINQTVGDYSTNGGIGQNPENKLNVQLSITNGSTTTEVVNAILYNSVIQLQLSIDAANRLSVSLDGLGYFSNVDASPSGFTPTQINSFAAVARVNGGVPANAGNNGLIFDNVTAVPEPSTVALAIIAGLGGIGMDIRKRKLAA